MYAHERSLVKKMAGKPFVLIGVNSDTDLNALKDALKKEHITWRSFKDRAGSTPISTTWHVQGWPTLYLIDDQGIIRQQWRGSPDDQVLDEAVAKLVRAVGSRRQSKK